MTMSIHKLTAGSGYDYLNRQVAALDATEKGYVPLASYYAERGETPGVWIGSGLAGIDGLKTGDPVTAEQMQALFGVGLHPLASERQQQLQGPDLTDRDYQAVTRLGAPFKIYAHDIPPFRVEVAKRIADLSAAAGLPRDWPVPRSERARVRTEVARELFAAEHGRPPQDARELAATIAKHSRPQTTAVAGYDLTFSPVKSVSTLWALADPAVAAQIEKAHRAAVSDALSFIERHALFSRTGANGIRQVDVQGLVAAAFTTATAAPETPTCTLMWPSLTRCKPLTDAGSASTAASCSRRPFPHRRLTTPPWRTTSATVSGSDSPNGRTRTRGNGQFEKSSASPPH